jgi:DUF1009 family protein
VERSLGLMCGAGLLPARMAAAARRQGWRVVAFTFGAAPGVEGHAARTIPSRLTEPAAVLAALGAEGVTAALFSGKFSARDLIAAQPGDTAAARMDARAGSRLDVRLIEVVIATLAEMGVTVLDQRPFLGDDLGGAGCWSGREPSADERKDVERGLAIARLAADAHVGQTVVVRHGAVTAVEAIEGTTEAIRRGTALAGPGAVVVKAVARDHDYRFDTPTIGPESLDAAAAGRAAVVAVEAGRVLVLDREQCVRRADAAGIALVGV